jgi:hypothetical protein
VQIVAKYRFTFKKSGLESEPMNEFVQRHFSPDFTDYEEVISLQKDPSADFHTLQALCPTLPKGWHELAQFNLDDRIEFVSGTWKNALPIVPHIEDFITSFFDQIEDIGIYVFKKKGVWDTRIVYSMSDGETYFLGRPPANDIEVAKLSELLDLSLPSDYTAFLKVHNGFQKDTDDGVLPIQFLRKERQVLQVAIADENQRLLYRGEAVDTETLFPFYKSLDLRLYQCFFTKWNPDGSMGNVFCSLGEGYLSDFLNQEESLETLAFPTFLDWLTFYMDGMEG